MAGSYHNYGGRQPFPVEGSEEESGQTNKWPGFHNKQTINGMSMPQPINPNQTMQSPNMQIGMGQPGMQSGITGMSGNPRGGQGPHPVTSPSMMGMPGSSSPHSIPVQTPPQPLQQSGMQPMPPTPGSIRVTGPHSIPVQNPPQSMQIGMSTNPQNIQRMAPQVLVTPGSIPGSPHSIPVQTPPQPMQSQNVNTKPITPLVNSMPADKHVISREKLQELVQMLDSSERLDPEAEDLLLLVADEFVDSVTEFACKLAKHRKSNTLEARDLELHLEKAWNIKIPGYCTSAPSGENMSVRRPNSMTTSHQQRLMEKKKAKK
jgi:transcription initiation factor TFIID subunit 12